MSILNLKKKNFKEKFLEYRQVFLENCFQNLNNFSIQKSGYEKVAQIVTTFLYGKFCSDLDSNFALEKVAQILQTTILKKVI